MSGPEDAAVDEDTVWGRLEAIRLRLCEIYERGSEVDTAQTECVADLVLILQDIVPKPPPLLPRKTYPKRS